MTCSAQLQIEFLSYWHSGTGRSGGGHVDALTDTDSHGLPFINGKHIKGLLLQAMRCLEQWGQLPQQPSGPANSLKELLFGSETQTTNRNKTAPGMIRVDNAEVPLNQDELDHLLADPKLVSAFFEDLHSTAINENGVADRYSLRGMQVCIPLTLRADISLHQTALDPELAQQQQQWLQQSDPWQPIKTMLPLVDRMGASRSRGLGECIVTLNTQAKGAAQ